MIFILAHVFSTTLYGYVAAVAVVAFTLKRLWALDLELRAHRERQRVRLREEQRRARQAADDERSDRLQQKGEKDRIDGD